MYTLHYYVVLDPPPPVVVEDDQHAPAWEESLKFKDLDARVALFVSGGIPVFARISIPGSQSNTTIAKDALEFIQICREHLLTCLWFTYDKTVRFFAASWWMFSEEGVAPQTNIALTVTATPGKINPEHVRLCFMTTVNIREELRLFQDGSDERLPLQYRYLSLYKILELVFRRRGRWDQVALRTALAAHESEFRQIVGSRSAVAYLHELRDKCAHIRTGATKKQVFGVTHLRHDQARRVEEALPMLRKVCAAIVNEQAGGNFWIGEGPPPADGPTAPAL